jgi:glucokinase
MSAEQAPAAIGVDVGGTKILALAVSAEGQALDERRIPTPRETGPAPGELVCDAIASLLRELDPTGAAAVGVGVPGVVAEGRRLVFAPNLANSLGADLAALLGARLDGRQVAIGNDANCALVGEHWVGAARGRDEALLVTLGTGIGGAVLSAGELLLGSQGAAGEFGHMVIERGGLACPCGRSGCWERYASGSGLRRHMEVAHSSGALSDELAADPEALFAAVRRGDAQALAVRATYVGWLAEGLANLASLYDPSVIVIAGGVSEEGEDLLGPARARFGELLAPAGRALPVLALAELDERSGAFGAASLGLRAADA